MILRGNFSSEILHGNTGISVLIPDKCEGPFRLVYLLHGLHGDHNTWLDNTMLPIFAKKYNVVFVMPQVNRSFYANLKYGRRYFDYISEELPRVTRNNFNVSAKREDTAIMGCSMGGYGALWFAISFPDQYGFCGAISPACLDVKKVLDALRKDYEKYINTGLEAKEILTDLYAIYGEGLEYRADYDVAHLVKNFPADKPMPKIYATCGIEDDLRNENLIFKDEMKNTTFDFTYEEWPGGHDWVFFNEALRKTLEVWLGS
jgi:S-formylglutathione hydrolase FrmB